jgi:phosphoesterase RecJ-like protein
MGNMNFRKIYKIIKKYNTIVIARHVGADPDALGSQIALKDIIRNTFPNKNVYAVGYPASKFKFMGELDRVNEEELENALLICVDLPDLKRLDGADIDKYAYRLKIDHHPFIEKYCDYEWIDDKASSASQMIIELVNNTRLKMTPYAAERLYMGLVSDTNRFLFEYTTPKTFDLVSKLIKETRINFTGLYENMYLRPLKEIKFQGYLANNLTVTDNGLAYVKIDEDMLKEYDVDTATAGNMINNFNYINEIIAWAFFTEDKNKGFIRGSIRSRGPIINETAAKFGGGGHIYASGVRLKNFDEVNELINALDSVCNDYNSNKED